MRILYRVRQFWRTISVKSDALELEKVSAFLNPEQAKLFFQLQPGEQQHALLMVRKLIEQGNHQPDLLVAALLHDVGKLRYRLNPFERAMVVLINSLLPALAHKWGNLPPGGWDTLPGWKKAFVLAQQHAAWGAEMAHHAGASALTQTLIRQHQHAHLEGASEVENSLLHKLWVVDNES